MKRRLEAIAGCTCALILGLTGYFAFMDILGEWMSRQGGVIGMGTPIENWRDWSFGGARTTEYNANPLLSWLVVIGWSLVVLHAASMKKGELRWPWLMAALAGCLACIGFGDYPAAITLSVAIVVATIRHPGPVLKPVGFGILLSGLSAGGIFVAWGASFANPPASVGRYALQVALFAAVAWLLTTLLRQIHPALFTRGLTAAIFAALLYTAPGCDSPMKAWSDRGDALRSIPWTPSAYHLRKALESYRLSEKEASVRRFEDVRSSTEKRLLPELLRHSDDMRLLPLLAWLQSDAAIRSGRRAEAFDALKALRAADDDNACLADEMEGWLLRAGEPKNAAMKFAESLIRMPGNPMAWYGLSVCQAEAGNLRAATEARAVAALLDPRLIFSPRSAAYPVHPSMDEVTATFERLTAELADRTDSSQTDRRRRYATWARAWSECKGDSMIFLSATEEAGPFSGAVRLVRSRARETVADACEEKVAAFVSASVALLCDRHVNIGQSLRIFDAFGHIGVSPLWMTPPSRLSRDAGPGWRTGLSIPGMNETAILRSYPTMTGWSEICSFREGGAGSSLCPFEENIPIKLLTYGAEDSKIPVPEKWLREKLGEIMRE